MLENKYNLSIWQGATFELTITVKDSAGATMNLTNYSARMQIRPSYDSGSITESLSTANGEISVEAANGKLQLELSAARTANISVDLSNTSKPPRSVYVYDLELVDPSSKVSKLMFGDLSVYAEVTR